MAGSSWASCRTKACDVARNKYSQACVGDGPVLFLRKPLFRSNAWTGGSGSFWRGARRLMAVTLKYLIAQASFPWHLVDLLPRHTHVDCLRCPCAHVCPERVRGICTHRLSLLPSPQALKVTHPYFLGTSTQGCYTRGEVEPYGQATGCIRNRLT